MATISEQLKGGIPDFARYPVDSRNPQGAALWIPGPLAKALADETEARKKIEGTGRRGGKIMEAHARPTFPNGKFFDDIGGGLVYATDANGLRKPFASVSFRALRALGNIWIDRLIINARKAQMRRFAQVCDAPGKQLGFRCVHKDYQNVDVDTDTDDIRRRCQEMDDRLRRFTRPVHASFGDVIENMIEEELVIDRRVIVTPKGKGGKINSYHMVDGECYSADTEVLTKRGWLRFDQVNTETDEFATRNQTSKAMEWQKAFYFHEADFAGNMIRFHSRTLDLLVTPNHRMLTTNNCDTRYEKIVPARDLLGVRQGNVQLPATSTWEGAEVEEVTIPAYSANARPVVMSGDDYAAFMGMYLAEGCVYAKRHEVMISQRPQSKGYDEFRALLIRVLGREPRHDGDKWTFKRISFAAHLVPLGQTLDKRIPDTILDMSRRQLAIFWQFYMLGDGWYEDRVVTDRGERPEGWPGRQRIGTASKQMADQLQEVAQKLGYSASIFCKETSGDVFMRNGRIIKSENIAPQYTVSLRTTKYQNFSTEEIAYDGKVYCVSVPNEVLYVRRKGQPVWCGNTVRPRLEVLASWMTANHESDYGRAERRIQMGLLDNPPLDRLGQPQFVDFLSAAYVQVIEDRVVAAWREEDIDVAIAHPSIRMNRWGYGTSLLEDSIGLSMLFMRAMRYNQNLFDVNYPEAILVVSGDYDEEGLTAFKRNVFEWDKTEASTRLPIVSGSDEQFKGELLRLRDTPKDMLMTELIRFVCNLKCAAYGMHPSEINVMPDGQGGAVVNVDQSQGDEIAQATERGFHSLAYGQADTLTAILIRPEYDDLMYVIEGLDREGEQGLAAKIESYATHSTFNELRAMRDQKALPKGVPIDPGDFLANPEYLSIIQLIQGAAQQQQQQDMGGYEQGNFGQPDDNAQQGGQPGAVPGQQMGTPGVPGGIGQPGTPGGPGGGVPQSPPAAAVGGVPGAPRPAAAGSPPPGRRRQGKSNPLFRSEELAHFHADGGIDWGGLVEANGNGHRDSRARDGRGRER